MNTIVIAFDGTAASGKGTVSKLLADQLHYDYLDTGLLFRKLALYFLEKNIDHTNESLLCDKIQKINLAKLTDLTNLYLDHVSNTASHIATFKGVRNALLKFQREFVKNKKGAVINGRDIGTVVFPDAKFKFFFDANIKERAKRRFIQLQQMGKNVTFELVLKHIKTRDKRDKTRKTAPLIRAKDSLLIDTSILRVSEILKIIFNKIGCN